MRRSWLAVTSVLLTCACAEEKSAWSGVVEELPGGRTRITNPAEGMWSDGTAWRLVPALALGEAGGQEAAVFGSISGLAVDESGGIWVLDGQANEIRTFTSEGEHLRSVGGPGNGPGEYVAANGLLWLAPDTLVVVDQEGGRYTLLSHDGAYLGSARRQLGFSARNFSGGVQNGRLYERITLGADQGHRMALLGTPLHGSDQQLDTVVLPVPPWPTQQRVSASGDRGIMIMVVPFAPGPIYHLDARGSIWHAHGAAFRVVRSTFGGDTLTEIALAVEPAPVTEEELSAWEGRESTKRFRQMGGEVELPRTKPFLDGLNVDPDGYLWASVPGGPTETIFAVFDPEGRFLGRLTLSAVMRDPAIEPVVRNNRLHFVTRDELGVAQVRVYSIEKPGVREQS